jgi:ribonuclease HII
MIGIDEVGRGCWAGPLLVVSARKIKPLPKELKDSKLLSRTKREAMFEKLILSCQFGEGWVTVSEIDKLGLAEALKRGVARSLSELDTELNEQIIMDGSVNYAPVKFTKSKCIINADNSVPIVSAASVYAKVLRDRYMTRLARKYPKYRFEKHVGYGTSAHISALKHYGVIDGIHRKSYKPIRAVLGDNS